MNNLQKISRCRFATLSSARQKILSAGLRVLLFASGVGLLFSAASCTTMPLTGRSQLTLVPQSTMNSMSSQQYQEFLNEAEVITGTKEAEMVQRVGKRLQRAAEYHLQSKSMAEQINEYDWEFNLIKDDSLNAWAMPGGKVVVYSGLLPVAEDDKGLAVVVGHEIAHALARHGNERMSQALAFQLGGMALSTAISKEPEETQRLWMAAFGLGAQYGVLYPFSRTHETEADRIGLMLMSLAGYDPHAALAFWERMMEKKDQPSPPEFLSTHPADDSRISNLRRAIPAVMPYQGMAQP
ncbi:MAG: M48 family metallopeptidase [Lentisphaeria bacterium]